MTPDEEIGSGPMENGGINNSTINPCTKEQVVGTMSENPEISEIEVKAEEKNPRKALIQKVEKIISEKTVPASKRDQARMIFYFIETLRGKKSREVDYYCDKISEVLDKGFTVEDLITATWNLSHNDFSMGKTAS